MNAKDELIAYLGAMDSNARMDDYWPLIVNFVAAWLAREGGRFGMYEADAEAMVASWREEMT